MNSSIQEQEEQLVTHRVSKNWHLNAPEVKKGSIPHDPELAFPYPSLPAAAQHLPNAFAGQTVPRYTSLPPPVPSSQPSPLAETESPI